MKIYKGHNILPWGFLTLSLILFNVHASGQEEQYRFDVDEFAKKAFSLDGYIEFRPSLAWLRQDSSLYTLKFYDRDNPKTLAQGYFAFLGDLSYRKSLFEALLEPYVDYLATQYESEASLNLFQGYLLLKPSIAFSVYAGKRTLRWGKGYAWSPTGFVERPKNPNEPDLVREGYWMIMADYTKSFAGALKTLSFTPVIIPVNSSINETFGREEGWNFSGKLYLLLLDTDLDFVVLAGKSLSSRFGLDFSRNLRSNWEIHGEIAHLNDVERTEVMDDGSIQKNIFDTTSYLLGMRYLSASETTYILEYYHDGTGYGSSGMQNFYTFVDRAYEEYAVSGDDSRLKEADSLKSYTGFTPMTDYIFLRIIQKDAFGAFYFNPAATVIVNLSDGSASWAPEATYKGFTNFELRLKAILLTGKSGDEFGEKPNRFRLELRVRYFF
jgi:hypothetical protein